MLRARGMRVNINDVEEEDVLESKRVDIDVHGYRGPRITAAGCYKLHMPWIRRLNYRPQRVETRSSAFTRGAHARVPRGTKNTTLERTKEQASERMNEPSFL